AALRAAHTSEGRNEARPRPRSPDATRPIAWTALDRAGYSSGLDAAGVVVGERVLHVARGGAADGLAEVADDHAEGHVDAGRDTGRCHDVVMLHHVQLLLDGHGRKGLAHPVER